MPLKSSEKSKKAQIDISSFCQNFLVGCLCFFSMITESGGGQGGERPGEKGAGGVREAGEEGAGGGIPKVAGSGRKREKIIQHCAIFRN